MASRTRRQSWAILVPMIHDFVREPSSLYCFLGSGTTCELWIEDQHAVLSVKIDDMQDIATRSKVHFLFIEWSTSTQHSRYSSSSYFWYVRGRRMSGMCRKEINLLRMLVEGNQRSLTLWSGRLWFPTCAGHCLGIERLGWRAIAVEVIVVCRRVFVHIRLVATHGDDVLVGVQDCPSF